MEYEGELRDGRAVLFRPLRPDDKEVIRRGFEALSPASRYRRFFREIDHLTEAQLAYLTEVDGVDHVAWLALVRETSGYRGAGVARWIRVPGEPSVAEGAVTVIDSLHGLGIGTTLLWLAARSAIERDVNAFRVVVQGENHPVLALLEGFGIHPQKWESGVAEIDIPLPGRPDDLAVTPSMIVMKAVARGAFPSLRLGASEWGTGFVGEEGNGDTEGGSAPDRT